MKLRSIFIFLAGYMNYALADGVCGHDSLCDSSHTTADCITRHFNNDNDNHDMPHYSKVTSRTSFRLLAVIALSGFG